MKPKKWVFECSAYAHIPKDERGKFDGKPQKCILVSYGKETKGYRLYDTGRQKIFHSRDKCFNEEEKTDKDATAAKKNEDATAADETRRVVLDLPSESGQESSGVMDDKAAESYSGMMDGKAAESSVRKSSREKHQTEFYGIERSHLSFQNEPVTYKEATASYDNLKWIKAMESEMKSLSDSNVWDTVPYLLGRKLLGANG